MLNLWYCSKICGQYNRRFGFSSIKPGVQRQNDGVVLVSEQFELASSKVSKYRETFRLIFIQQKTNNSSVSVKMIVVQVIQQQIKLFIERRLRNVKSEFLCNFINRLRTQFHYRKIRSFDKSSLIQEQLIWSGVFNVLR
jgi:hypothetical protein